jgi:uridine monophosphate synthetase
MMKDTVLKLYDIGAIKFGSFVLKSGIVSPIYIDLRESISYPPLLKEISELMWKKVAHKPFDRLCGVPYTALPMASYLSVAYNCPMIMRRKEAKDYGTKKIIEGVYSQDHTCVILEDLITSGASIFETIAPIEEAGMKVQDVVVFLDREQGGRGKLESKGYQLHSVITLSHVLDLLFENGRINDETRKSTIEFLNQGKP